MDGKLIIEFDIKAKTHICDYEDYQEWLSNHPNDDDEDWPEKVIYTKEQVEQMIYQWLQSKIENALEDFELDDNGDIVDMLQCDTSDYDVKDLVEIKTEVIQK